MHKTIKTTARINAARNTAAHNTAARLLLALGLSSVLAFPAAASSLDNSAAPNAQTRSGNHIQNMQGQYRQGQRGVFTPLKVTYYTADPAKGGRVISTLTLTRPDRSTLQNRANQNQPRPVNPIVAQAPAGATFAVIQGGRVIDLAQASQLRGQMRGPGRAVLDAQGGGPRGPYRPNGGQNDSSDQRRSPRN